MSEEITAAPLPAKIKRETDIAGAKIVFRCGVRDCPEILGLIRPDFIEGCFHFYKAYFPDAQGVYRCTRRSARRLKKEREHKAERIKSVQGMVARAKIRSRENPNAITAMGTSRDEHVRMVELYLEYEMASSKQRRIEGLQIPPLEAFPIVVKCARCGRCSIIKEETP